MGLNQEATKCLYLFSSNISPQYEQDILNLLAYPNGTKYQFRYDRKYINSEALQVWAENGLKDVEVLVHFSLQQAARYHPAVFFPVRRGRVATSERIGNDVHIIEFYLGDYVTLDEPPVADGKPEYAKVALQYTEELGRSVEDVPYRYSAALSANATGVLSNSGAGDSSIQFERSVRYLSLTDSFRKAWFFHVLGISERGQADYRTALDPETGIFALQGGRTYELHLLQRQPKEISDRQSFSVKADREILRVIGREGFEIASRYDRIRLPFNAAESRDGEVRETVLAIDPDGGSQGPVVRLPVSVRPSIRQAGTTLATGAGLFIVGIASVFPKDASLLKWLLVLAAVAINFVPRWTTVRQAVRFSARKSLESASYRSQDSGLL